MTTTNLPVGVTQFEQPCWHLIDPATGAPGDFTDGIPHYGSERAALDAARDRTESYRSVAEAPAPLVPQQLDAPCWIATAACGEHVEGDAFSYNHHLSGNDALSEALDCDFRVLGGVLRCEYHGYVCEPKTTA